MKYSTLITLSSVLAAPTLQPRQVISEVSITGLQGTAQQQLAQQQEQIALARLNAQIVSENVYRIQPTDPAATYSSALIILMPKQVAGSPAADVGQLAGGINSLKNGKPTPAGAAPVTPAVSPATPVIPQAPVPVTPVVPQGPAPVVAAPNVPAPVTTAAVVDAQAVNATAISPPATAQKAEKAPAGPMSKMKSFFTPGKSSEARNSASQSFAAAAGK